MIAHQSFDSLVQHLQGIRALFTAWGVGNLNSKTSQRIFYEYRVIEVSSLKSFGNIPLLFLILTCCR
jgi:hypothetical protein